MQESIFGVAERYCAESESSTMPLSTHLFLIFEDTFGQIVSLVLMKVINIKLKSLRAILRVLLPYAEEQHATLSQVVDCREFPRNTVIYHISQL